MKLPPTLFSTSTVMRMLSLIFCATRRAMTSVAPPAASPTSRRIGLPVSSCAGADAGADASNAAAAIAPSIERRSQVAIVSSIISLPRQQRSHDALARQRQVADAAAERAGDGVADGGAGRPDRGFAEPERRLVRRIDQPDVDLRHLGEAQDRVVLPGGRGDPAVGEAHALLEHEARA